MLSRANGSRVDFIENILGSKLITRSETLGECLVQLSCYLKRVQRRKEKPDQTQNTTDKEHLHLKCTIFNVTREGL